MTSARSLTTPTGAAIVRTKMRNLLTGQVIDPTFRSGDKVGRPDLEDKEVQYLYNDGDTYHFMDPESYDQWEINKDVLGDATFFMVDNMMCEILFYEGKAINIEQEGQLEAEQEQMQELIVGKDQFDF